MGQSQRAWSSVLSVYLLHIYTYKSQNSKTCYGFMLWFMICTYHFNVQHVGFHIILSILHQDYFSQNLKIRYGYDDQVSFLICTSDFTSEYILLQSNLDFLPRNKRRHNQIESKDERKHWKGTYHSRYIIQYCISSNLLDSKK